MRRIVSGIVAVGLLWVAAPAASSEPIEPGTLSYVGCSNTEDAVQGTVGEAFVDRYSTGGGSLARWASDSKTYRADFEANHMPGDPVWWNLCIRLDERIGPLGRQFPTHKAMIDAVASWLIPQSGDIWVSPLNLYDTDPVHVSTAAFHAEMVAYAVETYGLNVGPVLGPLSPEQLRRDGTHPNRRGKRFLGSQLDGFFTPLIGG